MAKGFTKAERLQEMIWLYLQRGYTDIEMAVRLDVDRTTVYRDRMELEREHLFIEEDAGRYRLDRVGYMPNIKVNLHEALVLYLATRRASHQTQIAQPHITGALEKLSVALKQPMTEHLVRAAGRVFTQNADLNRVRALESITLGWAECRKVDIHYKALKSRETRQHLVHPYLIEPSLWTDGAYLIGFSEQFGKTLTFKIERIEKAELKLARFDPPLNFDEEELLRYAWGIWSSESEPVTVRLRFKPGSAARRMRESVWHKTEKVIEEPDGGLLWEAQIAEWQEMLPWVRGWGADVEVLEPKELREALTREAQSLVELYKVIEITTRYYGHSLKDKDKSEWQLLKKHLTDTAQKAKEFGEDAGVGDLAHTAALLHDIGKYSKAFQRRLEGSGRKVDHATAGAREIRNLFNKDGLEKTLATILSYCIAGHHTGLPDYGDATDVDGTGTLLSRVEKKKLEDYSAYKTEIDPASLALKGRVLKTSNQAFSVAFMTRMIFSALVDADFQDTQNSMRQEVKPRGGYASVKKLCETFNTATQKFDNPQGEINKKRTETLTACKEGAERDQGFFTLTVPTGGGKTLASMAFALNHAKKHRLKRVIYVIPFTSIIEQNAAVFKEYLGDENVLEHHSNFDWKKGSKANEEEADDETKDALNKLKLASENWDIPIVVTTNVQFFESLFANKSSRCRKLHNIAKSVIIFDEAQMLPREYLDPCMLAVKELVTNYGSSVVFCTATQPSLNQRLPKQTFTELAPDPQALFDFYKRVQVKNIGKTSDADLLEKIQEHPQALCIVNTRRHAKGLFDQLEGEGNYHLSTLMCPSHRKAVLKDVRERLKKGELCRVISTQVMEAGIDVDFPVGFRALAGLDSIIQAAGRVNREMKRDVSDVYVFDPETPFIKKTPTFIKQGAAFAESVIRKFDGQIDSKEAIEDYFNSLYYVQAKGAFDVKKILSCFDNGFEFEFKKAAEAFRMIDNNTVAVVIPYNDEAKRLLEQAKDCPFPYTFARQLQMYTVNVYENEFEKLQSKGVIETVNDTYQILTERSMQEFYSEKTGLVLPADAGGDAVFFD